VSHICDPLQIQQGGQRFCMELFTKHSRAVTYIYNFFHWFLLSSIPIFKIPSILISIHIRFYKKKVHELFTMYSSTAMFFFIILLLGTLGFEICNSENEFEIPFLFVPQV